LLLGRRELCLVEHQRALCLAFRVEESGLRLRV